MLMLVAGCLSKPERGAQRSSKFPHLVVPTTDIRIVHGIARREPDIDRLRHLPLRGQPEILELNGRDFVVSSMAITGKVPVEGSAVEIQGDIDDGVLLATKIEYEPESAEKQGRIEFDVQGAITSIINDENGNVAEFVVDGNRLSLQTLTLFDGILERGMVVQVAGIVSEGQLLASRIEQIEELP